MKAPTLETERIWLKPISMEHWEEYAVSWADPDMVKFIGGDPRTRTESWLKFLGAAGTWPLLGYGQWAIIDRESSGYLGIGGLMRLERGVPKLEGFPEAGWGLVPQAWGRGLATEAMLAVLQWADTHLDCPEIRCIIDPGNSASRNVAEKLGFVYMCDSNDVMGEIQIFRRPPQGSPLS